MSGVIFGGRDERSKFGVWNERIGMRCHCGLVSLLFVKPQPGAVRQCFDEDDGIVHSLDHCDLLDVTA